MKIFPKKILKPKRRVVLLYVAIIVFLVFGGVLAYECIQKRESNLVQQPTVTQEEILESSNEIDTSNWLTYRNEEYGFEVKYPKEYILEQKPSYGDAFNSDFIYKGSDIINHISFRAIPVTQYIKDAIALDLGSNSCKGSKNDYICYVYHEESSEILRFDSIVKNNTKYEFAFSVKRVLEGSAQNNIDLFIKNQFNDKDYYLITTLELIKKFIIDFQNK